MQLPGLNASTPIYALIGPWTLVVDGRKARRNKRLDEAGIEAES